MKVKIYQKVLSLTLAFLMVFSLIGAEPIIAMAQDINDAVEINRLINADETPISTDEWEEDPEWIKEYTQPETLEGIDEEEKNNSFLESSEKDQNTFNKITKSPEEFLGEEEIEKIIDNWYALNEYSDIEEESKQKIFNYYKTNEQEILYLQKLGYAMPQIRRFVFVQKYSDTDVYFLSENCADVSLIKEYGNEITKLNNIINDDNISVEDKQELKKLLLVGYTVDEARLIYGIAWASETPISQVARIYPSGTIESLVNADHIKGNGIAQRFSENLDSAENEKIAGQLEALLENYAAENEIEADEFKANVNEAMAEAFAGGISTYAASSGSEIPFFGDAPYSFMNMGEESINLNSGALNIYSTDLSLPGRNGFDFTLSRFYDGSTSSLSKPIVALEYRRAYIPYFVLYEDGEFYGVDIHTQNTFYTNTSTLSDEQEEELERYIKDVLYDYKYDGIKAERGLHIENVGIQYTSTYESTTRNEVKLGQGWQLNIPYISSFTTHVSSGTSAIQAYTKDYEFLHLENGKIYMINTDAKPSDTSALVNYTYEDFTFKKANNGSTITVDGVKISYKYIMRYQDGRVKYFNDDNIVLYQDKYGNSIRYEYKTSNGLPQITITDSLKRKILIEGVPNSNGYDTKVSVDGEVVMSYEITEIPANKSYYILSSVTDQIGRTTKFQYNYQNVPAKIAKDTEWEFEFGWNYSSELNIPDVPINILLVELTKIVHPTGAETHYSYQTSKRTCQDGYETWSRITQRYDSLLGSVEKQNLYNYTYSSVGYSGYGNSNNKVGNYSTVVTDVDGVKTTYGFNSEHLKTSENQVVTVNNKTYRVYDKTTAYTKTLPNKEVVKIYSEDGAKFTETTYLYEYSTTTKNLLKSWSPLSEGVKSDEYLTSYTYDSTYQTPLTVTYKPDAETTVYKEYTLTSDKKNVTWQKVYETKLGGTKTLKEATEYLYDSQNNVVEERHYYDDMNSLNVFTSVKYDYSNTNTELPESYDGAFPTSMTITGVKDVDGNLIASPNGAGVVKTKYKFDKFGRLIEQSNASQSNGLTYYKYDALGRKIEEKYQNIKTQTIYDDVNNKITTVDANGNKFIYEYDSLGGLVKVIDNYTGKPLAAYTYNNKRQLSTVITYGNTGVQNVQLYSYDIRGREISEEIKDVNGITVYKNTTEYDNAYESKYMRTLVTIIGDSNSPTVTNISYSDKYGRTEKEGVLHNGEELLNSYTYDYSGNILTQLSALDKEKGLLSTKTNKYDYSGRLISETNADGFVLSYGYDALGRKVSFTDSKGSVEGYFTVFTYDKLGNVIMQSVPMENDDDIVTKYYYNADGMLIKQAVSNGTIGENSNYSISENIYDENNRLAYNVAYNKGKPLYTAYEYDNNSNVISMRTGMDSQSSYSYQRTRYTYDRFNNLTGVIYNDNKTEKYVYSINGLLLNKTDKAGNSTAYTYDSMGRLIRSNLGGEITEMTYTLTGQKLSEGNGVLTTYYKYDDIGRIVSEKENDITKSYTYDSASHRTSFTVLQGSAVVSETEYDYDNLGRLETVAENGTNVATYAYDENGNRKSLTYFNGIVESYTYNRANLVTDVFNQKGSELISSYGYTYYLNGDQHTKTDNEGKTTTYVYDDIGRLTEESESDGNTVKYTYDNYHNRKTMSVSGVDEYTINYTYNNVNWLLESNKFALNETEKTSYQYDANGNQIIKNISKFKPISSEKSRVTLETNSSYIEMYKYNGYNQLVESFVEGVKTEYRYKVNGLRYSKTTDGVATTHIWDGSNIVADMKGGEIATEYLRGIGLLASKEDGNYKTYLYNGHGDVVQLASESGEVLWRYNYDAFGVEKDIEGQDKTTDNNPFRYCGEYFDKETGTIYLRARYYDPVIGRFTQQDPINDGLNWYTYANNNPIRYVDPTGKNAYAGNLDPGVRELIASFALLLEGSAATGILPVGIAVYLGIQLEIPKEDFGMLGTDLIVLGYDANILNATTFMPDVERKAQKLVSNAIRFNAVYTLAFLDDKRELQFVSGMDLTYEEAYATLVGIQTMTNLTERQQFILNFANEHKTEKTHIPLWGIYTFEQADAKALAIPLGLGAGRPEHHWQAGKSGGFYGHYHGNFNGINHGMHIWFGEAITG